MAGIDREVADCLMALSQAPEASVGEPRAWHRPPIPGLPELSALLESAVLVPAVVRSEPWETLIWSIAGEGRTWSGPPPVGHDIGDVHPVQRAVAQSWGGATGLHGSAVSWWDGTLTQVLTAAVAEESLAEWVEASGPRSAGAEPIDPRDWDPVAVEANGNLTVVERSSGRILMYAADHSFDGLTELPGWPPYSLYTIDDCPDITTWIENAARAWGTGAGRSVGRRARGQ